MASIQTQKKLLICMNKWLKLLMGFIFSFLGLYFAFKNIEISDIIKSFESINYVWIHTAIILLFLGICISTIECCNNKILNLLNKSSKCDLSEK